MVDNSKLKYYSKWDIDQLIAEGEVAVISGTTTVYTITGTTALPAYELQFKPTGSNKWFNAGAGSTNNAGAGRFVWWSRIQGNAIVAITSTAGTIRYHIWSDKVNY